MITEAGTGQNETIGFPRFRNMIARKLEYTVIAELEDLFKRVDTDHDGFISASEFLMLMNGVDETVIQALFQEADTDEDGQLNCEEFVRRSTWSSVCMSLDCIMSGMRRRGFDFSRIQNAPFASQLKNSVCVCILKQVL
ncbi:calmodulin-1-like [Papaver somniferum]|uniref:calmodulin-1-like n=1 Tax=Papaver somniferum TaxID=3469 RepID=UPI000E6F48C2|nr:calmodulin-1-like [Papaver somniferum]